MIIIYTDQHQAHQPKYEIYDGQPVEYAESAARADAIIKELRDRQLGEIIEPDHFSLKHVYAIHPPEYVDFLKRSSERLSAGEDLYPSYFISDTYAPVTKGTFEAACGAVDGAMTGAKLVLNGERSVYALCRPPGHHASHHTMGGYCYFNNAAIAAEHMSATGKVAILDIDFHHGNGIQDAFYDRNDVLYVSIHADPTGSYPYSSGFKRETGIGPGEGFNVNYPVPLSTSDEDYLAVLESALADVKKFQPDFLVVSCGFDTFGQDPIGGFKLTVPVYGEIGKRIADLKLPTLLLQEGGYNVEYLGKIVAEFLKNFVS